MAFEINTPSGPAVKSPYGPILLSDLFDPDIDRGILKWKARPVELFSSKNAFAAWNARYAGKVALSAGDNRGYCVGAIFDRTTKAHRVIFAIHNGHWPTAHIDHLNGVRSDNRAENLRDVSRAENNRNTAVPKNNTSGVMGVLWDKQKQKWRARIISAGKQTHIGYFPDLESATAARKTAELTYGYHENHGRSA